MPLVRSSSGPSRRWRHPRYDGSQESFWATEETFALWRNPSVLDILVFHFFLVTALASLVFVGLLYFFHSQGAPEPFLFISRVFAFLLGGMAAMSVPLGVVIFFLPRLWVPVLLLRTVGTRPLRWPAWTLDTSLTRSRASRQVESLPQDAQEVARTLAPGFQGTLADLRLAALSLSTA